MAIASMEAGKRMNSMLPSRFYATVSHPSNQPIRISALFMERHGDSLGDSVFLKDSGSGRTEWEVELRAIDGETWFDKGWKEFVAFYSIKEECLLMFKYQGNSRFLVTIFDKTNNEISYPVDPCLQIQPVKVESESEPEENSAPVPVKKKGKVNQNRGNGRQLRNGRNSDGNSERRRTRAPRPRAIVRTYPRRDPGMNKVKACERIFKSEHPFFSVSIQPSHVSTNYIAGAPHHFCRAHFTEKELSGKGLEFSLRLSGEKKKWPIMLRNSRGFGMFRGSGWRQLAKQKELTVGEVCIFELVRKERVFNVYRLK